jgi:hypothetical protein
MAGAPPRWCLLPPTPAFVCATRPTRVPGGEGARDGDAGARPVPTAGMAPLAACVARWE